MLLSPLAPLQSFHQALSWLFRSGYTTTPHPPTQLHAAPGQCLQKSLTQVHADQLYHAVDAVNEL